MRIQNSIKRIVHPKDLGDSNHIIVLEFPTTNLSKKIMLKKHYVKALLVEFLIRTWCVGFFFLHDLMACLLTFVNIIFYLKSFKFSAS